MCERKQGLQLDKTNGDSASAPPRITPELIEHTLRVWQPYYQHKLSRDDALEIIRNATGFVKVLSEWQQIARTSR